MRSQVTQGGNIYTPQTGNFSYNQPAYLPVEGIGIAGSFKVKGTYRIKMNSNEDWTINIGATGSTPAGINGNVSFSGNAKLIVNGKVSSVHQFLVPNNLVYEKGMVPIGLTEISLPKTGNIQLELNISYQFRGPEGVAVPIPGLSRTINVPLFNPGYLSPKQ